MATITVPAAVEITDYAQNHIELCKTVKTDIEAIEAGTTIAPATTSTPGTMSAADKTKLNSMQAGTGTLTSGTVTISGVTLTASSRIIITMKDPGAGAITGMAGFDAPDAGRNVGAGRFTVNAIDDAKATIATAACTFDYLITN
mgnify:CR=1 FL=1